MRTHLLRRRCSPSQGVNSSILRAESDVCIASTELATCEYKNKQCEDTKENWNVKERRQRSNRPIARSINQSIDQSINRSYNQSINQKIHPSIDPSINQSTGLNNVCVQCIQTTHQSIYQTINRINDEEAFKKFETMSSLHISVKGLSFIDV